MSTCRWQQHRCRHRARIWNRCRQERARPESDHVVGRPQSLRRRADGDRVEAGYPLVASRPRPMSPSCARSCAISAPAMATWRRATCAPTSTCRCAVGRRSRQRVARSRTSTLIRFIGQAIEFEARRQIEIIEEGGSIVQETRLGIRSEQGRKPARCGRRKRRMTIAISRPGPACRWNSTMSLVSMR